MAAEDGEWSFQRVTQADFNAGETDRTQVLAEMSYATAPDFYSLAPVSREHVLAMIASQLGSPGTETSNLYVLACGDRDMALVAALPIEAVDRAKQASALAIIRKLNAADRAIYMENLSRYTALVEPFDTDSFYLNRIAVAAGARGSGVGTEAMRRFVDLGGGRDLSLHVKADNAPAIALYRRFGFEFVSEEGFQFRAMLKKSRPSSSMDYLR